VLLARLARPDGIAAAAALKPDDEIRRNCSRLLRRHLEYHTETDLALRSLRLAERIGNWDPPEDLKGSRGRVV
jgi:hypothetical protein